MTNKKEFDILFSGPVGYTLNEYNEASNVIYKSLERLEALEKENQSLHNELHSLMCYGIGNAQKDLLADNELLRQENEKLKKYKAFYEFIHNRFFIDLIEREDGTFKIGFEPKEPIQDQPRFVEVDCLLGNLLKEVLGDE